MARGVPSYDGDGNSCVGAGGGGGGGDSGRGGQYSTLQRSSSFPSADSFLISLNSGSIGDVFFGTDDISDTKELIYKEDVFESYRKELAMKSLRRQSKKKGSLGCVEFLKFLLRCCRCIW